MLVPPNKYQLMSNDIKIASLSWHSHVKCKSRFISVITANDSKYVVYAMQSTQFTSVQILTKQTHSEHELVAKAAMFANFQKSQACSVRSAATGQSWTILWPTPFAHPVLCAADLAAA